MLGGDRVVVTVVRIAVRFGVVLMCAAGWAVLPAAPASAAPGFDTALTELPGRFVAGRGAETVTAVVSTSLDGDCLKVRWALVLRVQGVRLNQVGVDRIEETGSFPVEVRTNGANARLTDRELDPGSLCRGRTVTAQYRLAVDDAARDGRITLTAEAYDAQGRLLDRSSATREVAGSAPERQRPSPTKPARPTPTPTVQPTEAEPTEAVDAEPSPAAEGSGEDGSYGEGEGAGSGADPTSAAADRGGIGAAQVGFVGGGVLFFLGGGLLLRMWTRNRSTPQAATVPAASARRGPPRYPAGNQAPAGTGRRRAHEARTSYDW